MSKKSEITIADIARMANVSKSTVSHVLNGTKFVNESTKNKVLQVVNETGYIVNVIAKSLKKSETKTIGLVISDIRNKYFIDVIHAIDEEARQHNYKVILGNSDDSEKRELEIIEALYERRVDGIIFSPTTNSASYTIPFLQRVGLPTVLVDRKLEMDFDWVGIENIEATRFLVKHLTDMGHRRIGLVAGLRGISTTEERIEGYRKALDEAGIEFDESLIVTGHSRSNPSEMRVMEMISENNSCPTAIIAANNLMVLGTMRALKKMNIDIPNDIALVSFDDFEGADLFKPALTAIAQPCWEIGSEAVRLLIRRIKEPESQYQQVCLTPQLITRESCGFNKIQ